MIVRCTAKIREFIDARSNATSAPLDPSDADWYANLLWFDHKKCLLLTHAGTLFSIFAADVRKADLNPIGPLVIRLIERELESEKLPPLTFGPLLPADVVITTASDRSVLGCMRDMALHCEYAIEGFGGLEHCDFIELNHRLRRNIHNPRGRGYIRPIDLAAQLDVVGK